MLLLFEKLLVHELFLITPVENQNLSKDGNPIAKVNNERQLFSWIGVKKKKEMVLPLAFHRGVDGDIGIWNNLSKFTQEL